MALTSNFIFYSRFLSTNSDTGHVLLSNQGGDHMNDYNYALFNALTDAIAALSEVVDALIKAQQAAEAHFVESSMPQV
jgi:hypothetical protein